MFVKLYQRSWTCSYHPLRDSTSCGVRFSSIRQVTVVAPETRDLLLCVLGERSSVVLSKHPKDSTSAATVHAVAQVKQIVLDAVDTFVLVAVVLECVPRSEGTQAEDKPSKVADCRCSLYVGITQVGCAGSVHLIFDLPANALVHDSSSS